MKKEEKIKIVKDFHKGVELQRQADNLMYGVSSISHEIKEGERIIISFIYKGKGYKIFGEDLING